MADVDPYELLGVTKDFTPEELKRQFKRAAVTFHPDRPNGNSMIFKLVIQAYKDLSEVYNRKHGHKQFNELKSDFKHYAQNDIKLDPSRAGFNVKNFNKIFDDNRIDSVHDSGYDEWLRNNPNKAEEHAVKYSGKFSNGKFNDHFEKNNRQEPSKHLIRYEEPQALSMSKKLQFTDIDEKDEGDFSAENKSLKHLNYMDLKIAYTTSRIVDPETVAKRKAYKSVDQLEQDRSQVSYTMNDEDLAVYLRKKKLEEEAEREREENIRQRDALVADRFARINQLLIGSRR